MTVIGKPGPEQFHLLHLISHSTKLTCVMGHVCGITTVLMSIWENTAQSTARSSWRASRKVWDCWGPPLGTGREFSRCLAGELGLLFLWRRLFPLSLAIPFLRLHRRRYVSLFGVRTASARIGTVIWPRLDLTGHSGGKKKKEKKKIDILRVHSHLFEVRRKRIVLIWKENVYAATELL